MSGGGGGLKKFMINAIIDKPAETYIATGALLYLVRRMQTQMTYNTYFGKMEFERRVERNQL